LQGIGGRSTVPAPCRQYGRYENDSGKNPEEKRYALHG
jgi:hypothetical protein